MVCAMEKLAFVAPALLPSLRPSALRPHRQTAHRPQTPSAVFRHHSRASPFAFPSTPPCAPRRDSATGGATSLDAGSGVGDLGGVGGSSGGSGGGGGSGDGSGDGDGIPGHVLAVLAAASRTASSVSPEVLSAASAGRVSSDVLARVLAVEAWPFFGALIRAWPALRNRIVANARFPMQMGTELLVGVTTKTLAEVSMRGERFWKEFDFYMSDLALEIVGDSMLVWLLSPAMFFGVAAKGGSVQSFFQRLPKHAFQAGPFSMTQRGSAFMFKGAQFALVGFVSSVVGHGLTTALVNQRKAGQAQDGDGKRRRDDEDEVQLAPVLPTSLTWGGFMFASSNPRYQMLNGFEQRLLFPFLEGKSALFGTLVTSTARFLNCYAGGVTWIPFAKAFGIQ